ncbi:MAG: hypothetical protein ACPG3S_04700 [Schleiferiaceae bacterium]
MKRTQIQDFEKIDQAKDLDDIVKDKRTGKRANKKKAKRRNRHYGRTLLKHFKENYEGFTPEDQNQAV